MGFAVKGRFFQGCGVNHSKPTSRQYVCRQSFTYQQAKGQYMSLKWELEYHEQHRDEAKQRENKAFHEMLDLVRELGGTPEHIDKAISIWVDGTMATSDAGWHRARRSDVESKIKELRSLIDMDEDAVLLK
jgi:hypothetical protein